MADLTIVKRLVGDWVLRWVGQKSFWNENKQKMPDEKQKTPSWRKIFIYGLTTDLGLSQIIGKFAC